MILKLMKHVYLILMGAVVFLAMPSLQSMQSNPDVLVSSKLYHGEVVWKEENYADAPHVISYEEERWKKYQYDYDKELVRLLGVYNDNYRNNEARDLICQLLKAGADPYVATPEGTLFFTIALTHNDSKIVEAFLDRGLNIHDVLNNRVKYRNDELENVLAHSTTYPELLATLKKHGIDPEYIDYKYSLDGLSLVSVRKRNHALMIGGIAAVVVGGCYGLYKWFFSKKDSASVRGLQPSADAKARTDKPKEQDQNKFEDKQQMNEKRNTQRVLKKA
jgi:hypothetical protein